MKMYPIALFLILLGVQSVQTLGKADVHWSTDTLNFKVNCSSDSTLRMLLQNKGKAQGVVTGVITYGPDARDFEITDDQLHYMPIETSPFPIDTGGSVWINVRFKPDIVSSLEPRQAFMVVSYQGGRDTLYLFGTITQPNLTTPTSVDFGAVPIFHYVTRFVPLINTGTGSLVIRSCTIDHPAFNITDIRPGPVIPAGGTDSIGVMIEAHSTDVIQASMTITTDNECSGTKQVALRFNGATSGVEVSNAKEELTIYPNPASGAITVILPNTIVEGTIKIFNAVGEERKSIRIEANKPYICIDRGALPEGVYRMLFQQGGQVISRTVILR